MLIQMDDTKVPVFWAQANRKGISLNAYVDELFGQLLGRIEAQDGFEIGLEDKVSLAEEVIIRGLQRFAGKPVALAWTGGKDSTLLLWLTRRACEQAGLDLPKIVLINEGAMFDEIVAFSKKLSKDWGFSYETIANEDVLRLVTSVGDVVKVSDLDERNQAEIQRLGYEKDSFVFEPESLVGNHLMKTVAQNLYLEREQIAALITGIRWDEQEARAQEQYFSSRGDEHTPEHMRIHPILHVNEKDVWEMHHAYSIPYCSLYEQGYRSLGASNSTYKSDDKPAWEQDLENTTERSGRNQDKEEIMKRLRDLGYM